VQKHLVLTHDTVIESPAMGEAWLAQNSPNPCCFAGFGLHDELGLPGRAGLSPMEGLTGRNDESRTISQSWIRRIDPAGQGTGELVGMQTAVAGSRLGSSRIYPGGDSASQSFLIEE